MCYVVASGACAVAHKSISTFTPAAGQIGFVCWACCMILHVVPVIHGIDWEL